MNLKEIHMNMSKTKIIEISAENLHLIACQKVKAENRLKEVRKFLESNVQKKFWLREELEKLLGEE